MRHAIILAGGSGTRFWPLSRKNRPKQLLALYSDKTMLEETMARAMPVVDQIHISTRPQLVGPIKAVVPGADLLVEPMKRDTAGAIGYCAARFDGDDLLAFLPSDHHISPDDVFQEDLKAAFEKAKKGDIVVIGVPPRFPSTGLGYIQPGEGDLVGSFKEKPDHKTAERFVEEGYLWNAGMFVATVDTLLSAFQKHAPQIYSAIMSIREGNDAKKAFETMPSISIDYAIMERASNIRFVPARFEWNDLGHLAALQEVLSEDNSLMGGGMLFVDNSKGNIIHSKKAVALIDCDDLMVVETDDAILVCPKKSAEKVKALQERLPEGLL